MVQIFLWFENFQTTLLFIFLCLRFMIIRVDPGIINMGHKNMSDRQWVRKHPFSSLVSAFL